MDNIVKIDSEDEFQKALQDVISSFYSTTSKKAKDSDIMKLAKEDVTKLLISCDYNTDKIPELLIDKGWDRKRITVFVNLLNEKKTELSYASLINQNSDYGETVMGFDWLLKIVLGTSEMNTLKYSLLQLILSTVNNGSQKNIIYDVNKDMLLKLIDVLQKHVDEL